MRKHDRLDSRIRWLAAGLAIFAILAGVAFIRETIRTQQIDNEIDTMRKEAEHLRIRNFEISKLESSLSSGEFLEREARMKLGLQKEGEQVVVVQKEVRPASNVIEPDSAERMDWSNTKKWWTYFTDPEAFQKYAASARDSENTSLRTY